MTSSNSRLRPRPVQLTTPDGAALSLALYEATSPPRGVLLIAGAVGVPQGFYARFARFAAREGLHVVTFDYRHFGASKDGGGPRATLSRWGDIDYPAVLRWTLERHTQLPLYVIGHSLGGQFLGLSPDSARIAGAATVASMSGYVGNLEHDRKRVELLFRYAVPAVSAALPQVPGWLGLGADLPSSAMRQWARWCLSPDYFLSEHPEYAERAQRFRQPLTVLSFQDDRIAPLANVRWLVRFYQQAQPTHVHLDPSRVGLGRVGHMGFFRESSRPLWQPLLSQLEHHDPAFSPRAYASLERAVLDDLKYGVA